MKTVLEHIENVDVVALEGKVKDMYTAVATNPHGDYHFEMGREMAERLGYEANDLNKIPQAAIESFAGVGYFFNLANLQPGDDVVDLGSGSGMDTFVAALKVGKQGSVVGVDMTDEQLNKSRRLRDSTGFNNIRYKKAYIENTGLDDSSFDVVISNGVINLSADKHAVFKEVARLLKPGGRFAIADIVTEVRLPSGITCDATLWAACIGGALQIGDYTAAIGAADLEVKFVQCNSQYRFLTENAQGATKKYGVKSVSILAEKTL